MKRTKARRCLDKALNEAAETIDHEIGVLEELVEYWTKSYNDLDAELAKARYLLSRVLDGYDRDEAIVYLMENGI